MTETQKLIVAAYEATGRIVAVRRSRKSGKISISLNGGCAVPLKDAIERMKETLRT